MTRNPKSPLLQSTILKISGLIGIAAAFALAGQAGAEDAKTPMLDKAFGSTIVSTYSDGRQGELWLKRDGSYTAAGRRKDRSDGHWQLQDGKLCLRQQHPATLPISYCTPLPTGGMDKPWSAKSVTGDPITVKLVKGMHGRDSGSKAAAPKPSDKG